MIDIERMLKELNEQVDGEVTFEEDEGVYSPMPGTHYKVYLNDEPTKVILNADMPVPDEEAFAEMVNMVVEYISLKK